jgi:hypothetical protein
MNGRTAWSFSARAFEASRNEHHSRLLRPIFFQFGVTWFWVALALEGRAIEVWQELREQNASAKNLTPGGVWGNCVEGLRKAVERSCDVPAWSLPDSRKMRSLGLGRMWAVLCPYCHCFHLHSPGDGRRTPHCCVDKDNGHYVLTFAGALPLQHHRRFYRSSRADLPRILRQWPDAARDQDPAAELLAA